MSTTIQQVSPVEYELEITASADELAPKLNEALKAQRRRTHMRGFRPGKVPLSLVKKMYGSALAFDLAQAYVQEVYEAEVVGSDDYDVLGQPKLTALDYDVDQDLRAVIRFGVRPQVELKDLSDEKVTKLVHAVTDEDVEAEIERLQLKEADIVPLDEEEALEAEDYAVVDLQRLDDATGTPIVGEKEEAVSFFLNDPRLKDELRDALVGRTPGETLRVELPTEEGDDEGRPTSELLSLPGEDAPAASVHRYEVIIREAKRRELPEVDEAFVQEVTDGRVEGVEAFREEVRERLEDAWARRSREFFEDKIRDRMRELHPIEVPESVTDTYLDSFVEDVRRRNENELPPEFDEAAFREHNRPEAEAQAHWMLLRDAVVADANLEVTDEDLEAHFEEMADEEVDAATLKQFYASMPNLIDGLRHNLIGRKVIDYLAEQFEVVEKDREQIEAEIEARRAALEAEAAAPAPAAEGASEEAPAEAEPADEAPSDAAPADEEADAPKETTA